MVQILVLLADSVLYTVHMKVSSFYDRRKNNQFRTPLKIRGSYTAQKAQTLHLFLRRDL